MTNFDYILNKRKYIMSEEKKLENTIVKEIEELYPETTKEFKRILKEQYEIFCNKQHTYGPDNISLGKDLLKDEDKKMSLMGLWFRKNDKINRLKEMIFNSKSDTVGESIDDTYKDLSNYSIIAQIVKNGKWGK